MLTVTDRYSGKSLTDREILAEVNRDHSDEWEDYTLNELQTVPHEVTAWLDPQFYIIGDDMLNIDQLAEDALNMAVGHIQDALGVLEGDHASIFFSDDVARNNLIGYINAHFIDERFRNANQ